MKSDLKSIFEFMKLSGKLKFVSRGCKATSDRWENPAEHSWSVALFAILLIPEFEKEFKTKIDRLKIHEMATVHDLVEIITSDVSAWNKVARANIKAEEDKAIKELCANLPTKTAKHVEELWNEYEAMKTIESKIVKGLDRLSPAIQRLTTGQAWHDVKASTKHLDEIQLPRLQFSQTLINLYNQLKFEGKELGYFDKE